MTEPLYVVTGIPRSGTSMVMRMLQSGGMDSITDAARPADADNPHGYFELAASHTLHADNAFVTALPDRAALKVVSFFLKHLPPEREYAVIQIVRDVSEVLASQKRMLERRGEPWNPADEKTLERSFNAHVRAIAQWMDEQPNMQRLRLNFGNIIEDPSQAARVLYDFCRPPAGPKSMAAAVDLSLYRNRLPGK